MFQSSGYVPLTPCPTRAPRLPGTEALKKSISTPSLHSLLGFGTPITEPGKGPFLPSFPELEQLKMSLSPTVET